MSLPTANACGTGRKCMYANHAGLILNSLSVFLTHAPNKTLTGINLYSSHSTQATLGTKGIRLPY
jgi:hypothetical protein